MIWFAAVYVAALLIPAVDDDVAAWEWGAWCIIVTLVLGFAVGMSAVIS